MKIALINGSPRAKSNASGYILEELKIFLQQDDNKVFDYHFKKPEVSIEEMRELAECNLLVFAFPLYVDGIPSHLLKCLTQLEEFFLTSNRKNIRVYSVLNCGFYEGHHNVLAIEMMKNWCAKAGLEWGQGVAIGAGGMLLGVKNVPLGSGPKKNLGKALTQLSSNILKDTSEEDMLITLNFPRILYKIAGEMGWRQLIKANGLRRKDLFLRK